MSGGLETPLRVAVVGPGLVGGSHWRCDFGAHHTVSF
jgi:hypothetical protein